MLNHKKYNFLKQYSFDSLNSEQQKFMLEYEIEQANENEKRKQVLKDQESKSKEVKTHPVITKTDVRNYFEYFYQKNNGIKFIETNYNKTQIDLICMYFARDKDFEKESNYKLYKGLGLIGNCGTGKTSIIKAFETLAKEYYKKHNSLYFWFVMNSCNMISLEYQSDETKRDLTNYTRGSRCFDDLGSEQLVFGDKNLMKQIFEQRYIEQFNLQKPNSRTHFTSNFLPNDLGLKYGEHVKDRLKQMCNFIPFEGESFRK